MNKLDKPKLNKTVNAKVIFHYTKPRVFSLLYKDEPLCKRDFLFYQQNSLQWMDWAIAPFHLRFAHLHG